jgi:D-alanyl-D-alanine carboxypeptidase (penicillin-binding protein 5/6)
MRQVAAPDVTAVSAILADFATGQILYAHNEHERRAPASLTKIVTAIVALQRGRQDQEIRVKSEDLAVTSVVGLQPCVSCCS